MKRLPTAGLAVMTAVFIGLIFLANQASAEGNLLLNPSFEEGGHIDSWINDGDAGVIWVFDWQHQEGKWAFGIGNDLEYSKDGAWGRCLQVVCDSKNPDNLYKVTPGETFTFKMWIKGEENYKGKASLKLEFFGYDRRLGFTDDPLASFQSKIHTGQFVWVQETVSGVVPKDAVSIAISGVSENIPKSMKNSYVWFDDASLTVSPAQR